MSCQKITPLYTFPNFKINVGNKYRKDFRRWAFSNLGLLFYDEHKYKPYYIYDNCNGLKGYSKYFAFKYCSYEELVWDSELKKPVKKKEENKMEEKKYFLNQDCVICYGKATARYVKGTKVTLSDQKIYASDEKFYQVYGCEALFPESVVEEYKEPLLSDVVEFGDVICTQNFEYKFAGKKDISGDLLAYRPDKKTTIRVTKKVFNREFKLKNK